MSYLVLALMLATGLLLIVGAYRQWAWLVNPPDHLWPFYSQALIKRVFGIKFLIIFTYLSGVIVLIGAGLIVYFGITSR